ncbi:MAG: 4'-phosphopantetheinyl transferase superfamily protein [Propionibacteriaceae bacterium]|nr:4'-phosphopantetheinyl transferase superfamily protein [Propionibacteriaceae bacterium]
MISLAIARSDGLGPDALARLRATVPASRRLRSEGYLRRVDRDASIVAFALLVHQWAALDARPLPDVVAGEHGKPCFARDVGWHFNLTHDASVCASVLAPVPVGVDVQARVPFDGDLFERIAAPGELPLRGALAAHDDLSLLWTRKEAVVKRTGRGLSTPLDAVDTWSATDVLSLSHDLLGVRVSVSAAGWSAADLAVGLRVHDLVVDPDGSFVPARGPLPRRVRMADLEPALAA